jgi:hypothetical protein
VGGAVGWQVLIDEQTVGVVRMGDGLCVDVAPGVHNLLIRRAMAFQTYELSRSITIESAKRLDLRLRQLGSGGVEFED